MKNVLERSLSCRVGGEINVLRTSETEGVGAGSLMCLQVLNKPDGAQDLTQRKALLFLDSLGVGQSQSPGQ